MSGLRTKDRPIFNKPPSQLNAPDEGREVRLDPARHCPSCGRFFDVAKIVKRRDNGYEYLCLGCAVKTDQERPAS